MVKDNTIVGNNMHNQVFSVYSSNLGFDSIFLDNNTVKKYFIWASFCNNVSLDLKRIKENRFENGIIHMKNCAGRLANTYIENYVHVSVSAISVTCNYEGHKYFLLNSQIILLFGIMGYHFQ